MPRLAVAFTLVVLLSLSSTAVARERLLSINLTAWSSGEYNISFQSPLTELTGYALFSSYAKYTVPDYVWALTGGNAVAPVLTLAPDYKRYLGDNVYIALGVWIFVDPNTTFVAYNTSTGYELPLTSNLVFSAYARYNISAYNQSLFYGTGLGLKL